MINIILHIIIKNINIKIIKYYNSSNKNLIHKSIKINKSFIQIIILTLFFV